MLALWEVIDKNRWKVTGRRRERPRPLATNQVEQWYCQPLGQEKWKTFLISTATKAYVVCFKYRHDGRRWFVNNRYSGCPTDRGWLMTAYHFTPVCPWENRNNTKPVFLYSVLDGHATWSNEGKTHIREYIYSTLCTNEVGVSYISNFNFFVLFCTSLKVDTIS